MVLIESRRCLVTDFALLIPEFKAIHDECLHSDVYDKVFNYIGFCYHPDSPYYQLMPNRRKAAVFNDFVKSKKYKTYVEFESIEMIANAIKKFKMLETTTDDQFEQSWLVKTEILLDSFQNFKSENSKDIVKEAKDHAMAIKILMETKKLLEDAVEKSKENRGNYEPSLLEQGKI